MVILLALLALIPLALATFWFTVAVRHSTSVVERIADYRVQWPLRQFPRKRAL